MRTTTYYEKYIVRTSNMLQEYFELPSIPSEVNEKYPNCSFFWGDNETHFLYGIKYLIKEGYFKLKEKKYNKKVTNIETSILLTILHEIGHYYQYAHLGEAKYRDINYTDRNKCITYKKRRVEKYADNFSKTHYEEAKLFLKECLK